jgi:hypothetical protein
LGCGLGSRLLGVYMRRWDEGKNSNGDAANEFAYRLHVHLHEK